MNDQLGEGASRKQQNNEIVDSTNIDSLRGQGSSEHQTSQLVEPVPSIIKLGGGKDRVVFLTVFTVGALAFVGGCFVLGYTLTGALQRFRKD